MPPLPVRAVIASANKGKVVEFRQMLEDHRLGWLDLSQVPPITAPEETGLTFADNAILKARYYATSLQMWALADDSGLVVDAIGGNPGVLSARWASVNGAGSGDAANNACLLSQMDAVPDSERTARFVCELALCDPAGNVRAQAAGTVEGVLLRAPRGGGGFGYDPLFLVPSLGLTTAELTPVQKHAISHRGQALRRMRALMEQLDIAG